MSVKSGEEEVLSGGSQNGITVRLLLPGSLKQNWPIRLQDKNNEFQPKPIEPITSTRKTAVKTKTLELFTVRIIL